MGLSVPGVFRSRGVPKFSCFCCLPPLPDLPRHPPSMCFLGCTISSSALVTVILVCYLGSVSAALLAFFWCCNTSDS